LFETGETQAAQQWLLQRARSILFGTCVVQSCAKCSWTEPFTLQDLVSATKGLHSTRSGPQHPWRMGKVRYSGCKMV
jgi:hypothetical protein